MKSILDDDDSPLPTPTFQTTYVIKYMMTI